MGKRRQGPMSWMIYEIRAPQERGSEECPSFGANQDRVNQNQSTRNLRGTSGLAYQWPGDNAIIVHTDEE